MLHFLIKSTNEMRVETMDDVERFHKELQEVARKDGFTLSSFSWSERVEKEKGEVIGVYYLVKYTYVFNDLKNPENPFFEVNFPKREVDVLAENEPEEEEF